MSRLDELREQAKKAQAAAAGDGAAGAEILPLSKPRYVAKERYQAYAAPTGDPQIRLAVYAKKFYMMPRYDVLYDVFFDGRGEFAGLIFPHHRLKLYGRNLLDIIAALRVNSVEWITEFDGSIHLPVTDPYAPVIEEIDTEYVDNPFLSEMQERKEKGE